MIAAIWGTIFWSLLGLFFGGIGFAFLVAVWKASRYTLRLELKRRKHEDRRRRLQATRPMRDDWQAVVLRRVMLQDHLAELRQEILAASEETPMRLVVVD